LQEVDFWIDMMPRTTYMIIYVLGLVVLAACLLAFRRIPLEQKRGNIDTVQLNID
jgi:hypothetical protein